MYVVPEARGPGVSRKILAALEEEALRLGHERLRLETAVHQLEAIGLYTSHGFERISNYGPYIGEARSLCLEKRL
jgi:GNAT superfamily N-acetyltransferase